MTVASNPTSTKKIPSAYEVPMPNQKRYGDELRLIANRDRRTHSLRIALEEKRNKNAAAATMTNAIR
jgi:hypothetical protein